MAFEWPDAQHVFFSPHLDDVVLSCGGTLFNLTRSGQTAAVVTIFAASPTPGRPLSPFAQSLHARWEESVGVEVGNPAAVRRKEDFRALRSISMAIQVLHYGLPDCIYRINPMTRKALYASEETLFGEIAPEDLAIEVLDNISPPPAGVMIYAPLGAGEHVDHQLVHQMVRSWALPHTRTRYYEDYPYVRAENVVSKTLEDRPDWTLITQPLSERAVQAKLDAAACYRSQISTFWQSEEMMRDALTEHTKDGGGERYWTSGI